MKLEKFTDAITSVPQGQKKHLLLGNGFSQACRSSIFAYGSLLEKADFSGLSAKAKAAFSALGTTDFEAVIRILKDASKLISLYDSSNSTLISTLTNDAKGLKDLLVETISKNHPSDPSNLNESEFRQARKFLSNFENVYTLNYDLLLYWTLMHEFNDRARTSSFDFDDGFRHPSGADEGTTYVSWEIENTNKQNVYYLHGALHIFESDTELKKYTWTRTGVKLMDQINESLEESFYPLIVAEGTSDQKMKRIMKSGYLLRGLKSLASIGGNLFIYGLSMSENDEHVLKRIERSKISTLWVGIYGDPDSDGNKRLIARTSTLGGKRGKKFPLEVRFYDASTAHVWTT